MPKESSPVQGAAANGGFEKPDVQSSPQLKRKAELQRSFNEGSADANGNIECIASGCGFVAGKVKGCVPCGDITYNTKHARFQQPLVEPCSKKGTINSGLLEIISKQPLTKGHTYIEGEDDADEPQDEDDYTSEGEEEDEEGEDNERKVDEEEDEEGEDNERKVDEGNSEQDDEDGYAEDNDKDNDDEDDNEPATKRRK